MTKPHAKTKNLMGQVAHGIPWFAIPAAVLLSLVVGYVIGWAAAERLPFLQVNRDTLWFITKIGCSLICAGRGWAIAKIPRHEPVKIKDIANSSSWLTALVIVGHLNFVSMAFMLLAVMFAFSAAPELGQFAAAFSGGP